MSSPVRSMVLITSFLLLAFVPSISSIHDEPASESYFRDPRPGIDDAVPWGGIRQARSGSMGPTCRQAAVPKILEQVCQENLYSYVLKLQGFGSRLYRAPGMYQATEWLSTLLLGNGNFSVEMHNFTLDRGNLGSFEVSNVIITLPGCNQSSDRVFYMFAHDDSVQYEDYDSLLEDSPGADDDASGCAAVIEAARVLGRYRFEDTLRFALFNAEEIGLYGSNYWAQNMSRTGENVPAFIDYDMIGYCTGSYDFELDLYYNPASSSIASDLFDANSRYGIGLKVLPYMTTGSIPSDIQSFYDQSFTGVMGIEEEFNPYYHTRSDTIDKMNFTLVRKSTQLAVASLSEWARILFTELSVLKGALTMSDGEPDENELVNVSVTINNSGNLDARNVDVAFYCDGSEFERRTVDIFSNSSVSSSVQWRAQKGVHDISVRVDPEDRIIEPDGSDNEGHTAALVNDVPKAVLIPSMARALTGQVIGFDATLSSDEVWGIEWFHFDLGDGNSTGWTPEPMVEWGYEQEGRYSITLLVRDAKGAVSQAASIEVEVLNRGPTSAPWSNVTRAMTFVPVQFHAEAMDIDGKMTMVWDFGDGTSSYETDPVHIYRRSGDYDVHLNVTDDDGASVDHLLRISIGDRAPLCWINMSAHTGDVRTDLEMEADGYDRDGSMTGYSWNLGDGSFSKDRHLFHRYGRPGSYRVVLEVFDDKGQRSTAEAIVTIMDTSPEAMGACYPKSVNLGEEVSFDGSASFDLEGPLMFSWDFGDGNASLGRLATHVYLRPGVYTPSLIVIDTSGNLDEVLLSNVTVRNRPPTARFVVIGALERNGTLVLDGTSSYDLDGPLEFHWDLGDGTEGAGQFMLKTYMRSGNFTVNLTVSDLQGSSDSYLLVLRIKEPEKEDDGEVPPREEEGNEGPEGAYLIALVCLVLALTVIVIFLFVQVLSLRRRSTDLKDNAWE